MKNIEGFHNPNKDVPKHDQAHPKKFEFKVDESDEAQKRNKRTRAEEEEEPVSQQADNPVGDFKSRLAAHPKKVPSHPTLVEVTANVPPPDAHFIPTEPLETEASLEVIVTTNATPFSQELREEEEILPTVIPMKKKREEPTTIAAAPPPTAAVIQPTGPLLTQAAPSYASLSPQMFELFEQLIGHMTIQEAKGISTITVSLSMPGSVFNDCDIVLDYYDTAAGAFNVELQGNPEAVALFTKHLAALEQAFRNTPYKVHLKTPTLSSKSRPMFHRKSPL